MKTKVIYEDEHIIVCRKPAGIAVQTQSCTRADMVSELKNYLKSSYLGVVHRLDQPVEGVLVFAKTKEAAASLSAQVQKDTMVKVYHARVYGIVEPEQATLEDLLYKDGQTNTSRVVDEKFLRGPKGKLAKKARLSYRVCAEEKIPRKTDGDKGKVAGGATEFDVITDLEIRLETGRHHQIRVQLANMGNPILGDTKYGTDSSKALAQELGLGLCLKAAELEFIHPAGKKRMKFSADS